jgi:hypothetical protein
MLMRNKRCQVSGVSPCAGANIKTSEPQNRRTREKENRRTAEPGKSEPQNRRTAEYRMSKGGIATLYPFIVNENVNRL